MARLNWGRTRIGREGADIAMGRSWQKGPAAEADRQNDDLAPQMRPARTGGIKITTVVAYPKPLIFYRKYKSGKWQEWYDNMPKAIEAAQLLRKRSGSKIRVYEVRVEPTCEARIAMESDPSYLGISAKAVWPRNLSPRSLRFPPRVAR